VKKEVEDAENDDPNEGEDEATDKIQEALMGISKPKVINMSSEMDSIDDKYQLASEVDKSGNKDDGKKDLATVKREEFLNIYKADSGDAQVEDDTPDLSQGIKFQREDPKI
jgi:hypothetical protein